MYNKQIGYYDVENIYTTISMRKDAVQWQNPRSATFKKN